MTGLIYKDLLTLKKQLGTYLVFFIIYGGFCAAGIFDTAILGGLVTLTGMIVPMSSVAADDATRWNRYAVATPAGRRGVVTGKYLFTLLMLAGSFAVVSLLLVLLSLAGVGESTLPDLILVTALCTALGLLLDAVVLPLLLKFGSERARVISMTLFVAIFGGSVLLGGLLGKGRLPALPGWLTSALPGLLAILAVGGFALSYCIAQGIYAKKEF